jgi:hypothetical protein
MEAVWRQIRAGRDCWWRDRKDIPSIPGRKATFRPRRYPLMTVRLQVGADQMRARTGALRERDGRARQAVAVSVLALAWEGNSQSATSVLTPRASSVFMPWASRRVEARAARRTGMPGTLMKAAGAGVWPLMARWRRRQRRPTAGHRGHCRGDPRPPCQSHSLGLLAASPVAPGCGDGVFIRAPRAAHLNCTSGGFHRSEGRCTDDHYAHAGNRAGRAGH